MKQAKKAKKAKAKTAKRKPARRLSAVDTQRIDALQAMLVLVKRLGDRVDALEMRYVELTRSMPLPCAPAEPEPAQPEQPAAGEPVQSDTLVEG